jgi:dolichol-phosphate mannosyltransferase
VKSDIAVVIPAYKVASTIVSLISMIGNEVKWIIIVDDFCPQGSGHVALEGSTDPRVEVIFHDSNKGVGGAVKTGYKAAIAKGAKILVKLDGDGQMNPGLIPKLVIPLVDGYAEYSKGNRFYNLKGIHAMPKVRIIGNLGLTFMTKLSTGYWEIFDPTNGFTAISSSVVDELDLDDIEDRYFFESDVLFHLGMLKAVVIDVPMPAVYGNEKSNLSIGKSLFEFSGKHIKNFFTRIFYNYFIRDFTVASIQLLTGLLVSLFGVVLGLNSWLHSVRTNEPSEPGTIVLVALLVIVGFQLLLNFVSYDMASSPSNRRGESRRS